MDDETQIRTFMAEQDLLINQDPLRVSAQFPLLESGALDSLGVFQLIRFLENRYAFRIEWLDMTKATFNTIDDMVGLVRRKTAVNGLRK